MEEVVEDRKRGMGIYRFYICVSGNVTLTNAVKEDFVLADLNVRYLDDFGIFIYIYAGLLHILQYTHLKQVVSVKTAELKMSSLLT